MKVAVATSVLAIAAMGFVTAVVASPLSSNKTRESVIIQLGDTLAPRFSVRTDSVLKVVGTRIVGAKCGDGVLYLRTQQRTTYVTGDTINIHVACVPTVPPPPPPPQKGTLTVCLRPDPDSMAKYHVTSGDTTIDDKLVPCLDK